MRVPSDSKKQAVWEAYRDRHPTRVPLRWNTNARIILLNPKLNPEGFTFEQYTFDPKVLMTVQSRWQEYVATTLSRVSDAPSKLPQEWSFYVDCQNTYDGAYFGTPLDYPAGQCPVNHPCVTAGTLDEFMARDFSHPLDNPWIRERLAFHEQLSRAARDFRYRRRKGKVATFSLGFDGPLTVAAVLMGSEIFAMLGENPRKARALMEKLVKAGIARNKALARRNNGNWKKGKWGGHADDSIQLISTAMYEKLVMPLHEYWYSQTSNTTPASRRRSIHLCGDATRHFPTIHRKLGVVSFDTGFPVDHGALRKALGPEVEISGGPHVGLLRDGTPEQCAARTKEILSSGVKEGGRFILQEGNNLPPCCPLPNLAAVYETCIEHGRYD